MFEELEPIFQKQGLFLSHGLVEVLEQKISDQIDESEYGEPFDFSFSFEADQNAKVTFFGSVVPEDLTGQGEDFLSMIPGFHGIEFHKENEEPVRVPFEYEMPC